TVQDSRRPAEAEESQVVPHGAAFRGNLGFCLSRLETPFLSGKAACQAIPGTLFAPSERGRNQLHVPPPAGSQYAHRLGGSHSARFSFRAQGEYADHACSKAERRRSFHCVVSEIDRSTAIRPAARTDFVPASSHAQMRSALACGIPVPAS